MSLSFSVKFTSNEWKYFKYRKLPKAALKYIDDRQACNGPGGWLACWYKGETPATATDWAFVTDDGWFYKVDAHYSFWFPETSTKMSMRCSWSKKHLLENIKLFLETGETTRDPEYQS